jgi:hypothetical protein
MTMIDEEEITRLLRQLGDSFDVSDEAQVAILEEGIPEAHLQAEVHERGTRIRSLASFIDHRQKGVTCRSDPGPSRGRRHHTGGGATERFTESNWKCIVFARRELRASNCRFTTRAFSLTGLTRHRRHWISWLVRGGRGSFPRFEFRVVCRDDWQ